jgi:hypothetical protein
MSSRKVLIGSTVIVAVLLAVALGGFSRANTRLKGQPERERVAAGMADRLAAVRKGTEALSQADGYDEAQGAQESLGSAVAGFDESLLALAQGGPASGIDGAALALPVPQADPAAEPLAKALAGWQEIGPRLTDLAGGRHEVNSPAGREALALLTVTAPHVEQALQNARTAIEARGAAERKILTASVVASAVLGSALLALGGALTLATRGQWSRIRLPKRTKKEKAPKAPKPSKTLRANEDEHEHEPEAPAVVRRAEPAPEPMRAAAARPAVVLPMDLDLASASVDKVVVDMATIAGTTAKLQAAIDSVASAMQGMLFSLTEMAQDTGEGVRITRTANNAATYTAEAARELVASAREMAQIVARVRQLAQHSQEIARQVEDDAAQTGATGEAFTTVVAGEVRKLASATAAATQQIEATVADVLGSQRQYEEAIGQVIRNVSAIHRVCAHLGELMLDPPARVQPGVAVSYAPPPPPPPPAPAPAPAPQPAPPVAQAPAPAPTVAAIAAVEARVETELSIDLIMPEPVVAAPPPPPPPAPAPEPAPEPAPAPVAAPAPEPAPAPVVAAPAPEPAPEPVVAAESQKPAGSNANVFILKPKKKPGSDAPEPVTEAAPQPELEPVMVGGGDKPPENEEKPVAQGASGNIFMLNKKKK